MDGAHVPSGHDGGWLGERLEPVRKRCDVVVRSWLGDGAEGQFLYIAESSEESALPCVGPVVVNVRWHETYGGEISELLEMLRTKPADVLVVVADAGAETTFFGH